MQRSLNNLLTVELTDFELGCILFSYPPTTPNSIDIRSLIGEKVTERDDMG